MQHTDTAYIKAAALLRECQNMASLWAVQQRRSAFQGLTLGTGVLYSFPAASFPRSGSYGRGCDRCIMIWRESAHGLTVARMSTADRRECVARSSKHMVAASRRQVVATSLLGHGFPGEAILGVRGSFRYRTHTAYASRWRSLPGSD